jgi:hypothetical protein
LAFGGKCSRFPSQATQLSHQEQQISYTDDPGDNVAAVHKDTLAMQVDF